MTDLVSYTFFNQLTYGFNQEILLFSRKEKLTFLSLE